MNFIDVKKHSFGHLLKLSPVHCDKNIKVLIRLGSLLKLANSCNNSGCTLNAQVFHPFFHVFCNKLANLCNMFQPNHIPRLVNTIIKYLCLQMYTISEMPSLKWANRFKEGVCKNTLGCLCYSFASRPCWWHCDEVGLSGQGTENSGRPADLRKYSWEEWHLISLETIIAKSHSCRPCWLISLIHKL